MNRPYHVYDKHWQEWLNSAVDPDVISLNVRSLEGDEPYEKLLQNWDSSRIQLDAIWREIHRRFGKNWGDGGWWSSGVDVLSGENSHWGCFKPNQPRIDKSKGFNPNKPKPIKYEHPVKTPTEIFALQVPRHIWQKISERYSVPIGDYICFWEWVKDHPEIPLTITEGAKKAGALLTAGYAAIALPGVRSGYRQPRDEFGNKTGLPYLIPQLQAFAQRIREIYLVFDQDTKQRTVRDVNRAISNTAKLFNKQGCKVKVVVWHPELGKGADDVIVTYGVETIDKAFETALPSEIWGVVQLVKLTYPIDLEVNYEKLTEEIEQKKYQARFFPPPGYQLICLKSPKNTAKTELLACQIQEFINKGGRVLVLTHRIQLGEALCDRFGIDYVTELKESETGGVFGYGLCVDSLHPKSQARFNPVDWEGAWIVIDEAEQVIWHLLNSSTCQSERVAILRCLKKVIQLALSTGGKVFLSDADLSDTAIDYVRALAGFDLKPWVAVNNWKPKQGWQVSNYGGSNPSRLVADLEQQIEQGGKHFVCASGQKKKSQWGTQILEAHLKAKFPEKAILRIDRESIADPQHPAYGCMTHLNELLPQYDVVLASPTIETGVSIDCDHFTAVWGIFQGVQTCDSVRQALARVRANIPRYVWARKTGFSRVGNGSISITTLLGSQHKLTQNNINLLSQAGVMEEIDSEFQPESLLVWAKKAVVVNLGMGAYRATILKALQDEGHTIIDVEGDEAAAEIVKDEVKAVKEVEYQSHCEAVAAAASVDDKAFVALKEKRAKTESERFQHEKGELERRYRVPVTDELVRKNDESWHPKIRLYYYLSQGREQLPAREANVIRNMLEAGEGAIFKPDLNRSMLGTKIALLDWLGFDRLLEQREFSSKDSVILDIEQKAKAHSFDMRAELGVSVSEKDSPMAIARRLVELIGYRFPFLRREGARGKQIRIYGAAAADFIRDDEGKDFINDQGQAIPVADGRDEVFAAWLERDTAAAATAQQQEMGGKVENVSEFDTVARGNKDLITIGDGYQQGGVATDFSTTELPELVEALGSCESVVDFAAVVEGIETQTVIDAITVQDSQPRRQQLQQWWEQGLAELALPKLPEEAVEVTQDNQLPPLESYQLGDEVWGFFPMSEAKWLKAVVVGIGHGFIRIKSGFLGMMVERPDAIAPDWYQWCDA